VSTAACIIIGDEILSGKTRDTNCPLLVDLCRELGVSLRRIVTIGDEVETIADEVRACSAGFDYVFTSGGIGPTHDDRTIEAIARAFELRVVLAPELEAVVRGHWGERLTPAALKLAEVPEGARLLGGPGVRFPTVAVRNVFILPGVPQLFAEKLASLRGELAGVPEAIHSIYLRSDETAIAASLARIEALHPGVRVGSYPRLGDPAYRVRVTLEGADAALVGRATDRLLELLPAGEVLRVER
jgi:molybdenum cofactor synthesis domain-containing protein